MGTRCRGLGEICARLTGPATVRKLGQIVTRVQITERKSSIPQIVEIVANAASYTSVKAAALQAGNGLSKGSGPGDRRAT